MTDMPSTEPSADAFDAGAVDPGAPIAEGAVSDDSGSVDAAAGAGEVSADAAITPDTSDPLASEGDSAPSATIDRTPSGDGVPTDVAPESAPTADVAPAKVRRVKVVKNDAVLTSEAAREAARAAVVDIAYRDTVGEHLGFEMNTERLGTHYFASLAPGYPDWRWAVSVARAPRAKVATVCETNLLPTEASVLAPEWVPWAERLAPGDLSAGDVLPYKEDDPRLEQGFEATGNEDVDQVAIVELGLGRRRVLSAEGRDEAAQRWYDGDQGPSADVARKAPAPCSTCGYFLPMAGVLRQQFGVCANDWSPADGKVVSLDFGCGAHSEIDMEEPQAHDHQDAPVLDEFGADLEVEQNEGADTSADASSEAEASASADEDAAPDQNTSPATDAAAGHA